MKIPAMEAVKQLYHFKTGLLNLDPSTHSCKHLHEYVSRIIYFIYANGIDDDKYNSFTSELENDISVINSFNHTGMSTNSRDLFLLCQSEAALTVASLISNLQFRPSAINQ